jgi:hypothetical protein
MQLRRPTGSNRAKTPQQLVERDRVAPHAHTRCSRSPTGSSTRRVLAGFSPTFPSFYLYDPNRRNQSTKLRALVDYAKRRN